MSLLALPRELQLHILSFLDFRDMIRCSFVCQHINKLTDDDMYWKMQCKVHWDQDDCSAGLTWKEYFVQWYSDMGSYVGIYCKVLKAWNQIKSFARINCLDIVDSLNAGATESELSSVEEQLGTKLPRDLRCVYRVHNGQRLEDVTGLFGTVQNYDHFRNERMISLDEMLRDGEDESSFISAVRTLGLLRITRCDYSGVTRFLCVSDKDGFEIGTIYAPTALCYPVSNLRKLAGNSFFVSARSYLDWFVNYAQELENKTLSVTNFGEPKPYICRFYQEPGCVAVTGHVRVSVATAFIPEMSNTKQPSFTFAYRILMSMDPDVAPRHSCQLTHRHWVITDEEGTESRVDGPGVIGQYPVMKPGSNYSYVSCTNFKTKYGEMKGTYTFLILATGETLEVVVPLFRMRCPEILTSEERKERKSQEQKRA